MESGNPLLDDFVSSLTGEVRPRICFLPTASGDADHYIVRLYNAFRDTAYPAHISLFRRERGVGNIRDHLLAQDLIYVGGGSVVNMLAVWRAHGIDEILHEAWERGIVLCGLEKATVAAAVRLAVEGAGDEREIPEAYRVRNVSERVVRLLVGTAGLLHGWNGIVVQDLQ